MLPFETPTEQKSPHSFTLKRPVVNFEVVDEQCTLVKSFDPPIILYLASATGDLREAGGEPFPVLLAIWLSLSGTDVERLGKIHTG